MKKLFTFTVLMVMTISVAAMSVSKSRRYSLFLSDKMAYELDLTPDQYEAVYQINYDYFRSIYTRYDVDRYLPIRDENLYYVLDWYQYEVYSVIEYFYNPAVYLTSGWSIPVYLRYTNRHFFYRTYPVAYRSYRGAYIGNPGYYRTYTWTMPVSYVNMHPSVIPPRGSHRGPSRYGSLINNGNPHYNFVNPIPAHRQGVNRTNNGNNPPVNNNNNNGNRPGGNNNHNNNNQNHNNNVNRPGGNNNNNIARPAQSNDRTSRQINSNNNNNNNVSRPANNNVSRPTSNNNNVTRPSNNNVSRPSSNNNVSRPSSNNNSYSRPSNSSSRPSSSNSNVSRPSSSSSGSGVPVRRGR